MKYMKKALSLLLISSLAAGATACGSSSGKASGEKSEDGVITLRILENDTAKSEGYLDELLNEFNEAYKDKGIVAVDANMDEYSNLAENGPYGYGPDVLYQANDKLMTYAEDKHILALNRDDFECAKLIPEEAWDAFTIVVDGKQYTCAIPVNVQEPMLFYRKDKLPENWETDWDKDGDKTPDFFQNWSSLYQYSEQIQDDSDGENYGLVAACNDLYMMAEFMFSYGGYVFGKDENGISNPEDVGFGKADAAKGMMGLRQFAGVMSEECIDDSIGQNRYSKVADGTYFCSISTPDTYVLFHDRLADVYKAEGLSDAEASDKATENLGMIELPGKMPADGNLSGNDTEVDTVVMGGVNGYGISAYTEHKEACIEFVNFATSREMIKKRAEILGIAPTRSDVAEEIGGVTGMIFESLNAGHISLMPSVKAVDQIWDPMRTLLSDVAKDAFREIKGEEVKYSDEAAMQEALDKASQSIYDAIFTLSK
ncbi:MULTISPECIES: sugar ABC transporter substrate-binding protein [unclassified Butyrivibrio]|uniref:sugar ABC transporter substrate-binding protein n=1 Tax=unclassified Butyrivibrio TaxID=2639466 RepID=UPI0003F57707|nr:MULTISPECIES: extracellular solute-binding protein [unclassified Butyrivibrio]